MRIVFCSIALFLILQPIYSEEREKIFSLLNREIIVEDNFAGQSFTFVKEGNGYFVLRKIFGSGLPVIATIKYRANITSDYQIRFSKVEKKEKKGKEQVKDEEFIVIIYEGNKFALYLNGLQVVTREK